MALDPAVEELLQSIERSPAVLAAAETELIAALKRREIYFGDDLLPTYTVPFYLPEPQLARWIDQTDSLIEPIERVAQQAMEDPELFAALGLRPDAQELIRIDPGYRRITMLSRPDAIVHKGDLTFLEFNCDSPAMMAFSDVVAECLLELDVHAPLRARARPENMTQCLLDSLLACYREYGGSASPPTIAISDWEGQKTRYEHRQIARFFEKRGYPTIVCDPRAFRRRGRALEIDGRQVDIVYRRALFGELLDRQAEVVPLLSAYRDGAICMVNPLRSYVASSKTLLALLFADWPRFGTRPEGGRYIAKTSLISAADAARLRSGPRRHVLKRGESHGGQHVLLPKLATDTQWAEALDDSLTAPWIMQDYYDVPTMTVVKHHEAKVVREHKYFNWNPFLFGGHYAGSIARASDTPLINICLGGGLLPTLPFAV